MDTLMIFLFVSAVLVHSVLSAPRHPRLSLAEPMNNYYYTNIDGYPGTYSFGYDVTDPATGNIQFRNEERYPNGTVVGNYGYIDALGKPRRFNYIADEQGYRVKTVSPTPSYSTENIINKEPESSIIWTRPKKPSKVVNNDIVQEQNNLNDNDNFIHPPSYYAID